MASASKSSEISYKTNQKGGKVLVFKESEYIHNLTKKTGVQYWKCRNRKCPGRLVVTPNETPKISQPHLAGEYDIIRSQADEVMATLKEETLSSKTVIRPQELLTSVLSRAPLEVRAYLPEDDYLKRLIRIWSAKAEGRKEPSTRADIIVTDFKTLRGEDFFIYDSGDENRILLFSTKTNLKELSLCRTWLCDGTFKIAPQLYTQLYTVHGLSDDGWVLPYCYALLPCKSAAIYKEMFKAIEDAASNYGWPLYPDMVIMDFENAAIIGLLDTFPSTKPQGCYFHFCQNLWKNLGSELQQACNTNAKLSTYIRSFFALAFLPEKDVLHAFSYLCNTFPGPFSLNSNVKAFQDYLLRTYIGNTYINSKYRITFWNVHNRVLESLPRSNNVVEGWNHKINYVAGCSHPSFFRFLRIMAEEQERTDQKLELKKRQPSTPSKLKYRKINENIKSLVNMYVSGNKELSDFLEGIAINTHSYVITKYKSKRVLLANSEPNTDNDNEENEEPTPPSVKNRRVNAS